MNGRPVRSGVARAVAVVMGVLVAGCGGGGSGADDAGVPSDAFVAIADAAPARDGAALWVDFTASGCEAMPDSDPQAPPVRCRGAAPLTVRFAAIVPDEVDTFAWSFGDGAHAAAAAPTHLYAATGRYDVAVSVAREGSTATAARTAFIEVVGAPLGAACARNAQCAAGTCLCGSGESPTCPAELATGLCTAACTGCAGGVCAELVGEQPWQRALCLAPCATSDDCPSGRSCEVVSSMGGWVRACLPAGALASLGAACASASGFDDTRCSSGTCLGIGVRGVCSVACGPLAPCPSGSRCATLAGASAGTCLSTCDAGDDCGGDPWLGCEAPHAGGFVLDGGGTDTVCAPRRCDGADDCPGGACKAGHCAAP